MNRLYTLAISFALAVGLAASAAAQAEVWTIDTAHSSAQFAVKHMMVSTVRGTLGPVKGTADWDGKDVKTLRVDATIDVTGLSTQNEKRDTHLKSADFFDAANHPAITFKSKRVEPGAAGHFKLIGDLTIRGNTHEVALDVEGPSPPMKQRNSFRTGASATARISRKQFGLQWNNLMETGGAVVGDEVQITIDTELTKQIASTQQ
jgi:polyisoprenoid-binding protein YceI